MRHWEGWLFTSIYHKTSIIQPSINQHCALTYLKTFWGTKKLMLNILSFIQNALLCKLIACLPLCSNNQISTVTHHSPWAIFYKIVITGRKAHPQTKEPGLENLNIQIAEIIHLSFIETTQCIFLLRTEDKSTLNINAKSIL